MQFSLTRALAVSAFGTVPGLLLIRAGNVAAGLPVAVTLGAILFVIAGFSSSWSELGGYRRIFLWTLLACIVVVVPVGWSISLNVPNISFWGIQVFGFAFLAGASLLADLDKGENPHPAQMTIGDADSETRI